MTLNETGSVKFHGELSKMYESEIRLVATQSEYQDLDQLLWDVLWSPVGLPRNIRESFIIEGEGLDLIAMVGSEVVGGLVANWTFPIEVELRHLAVKPERQGQNIGKNLVDKLISIVSQRGCERICTISRNTSKRFFQKLGFAPSPGKGPEHPAFAKHGISFNLMEFRIGKDKTD